MKKIILTLAIAVLPFLVSAQESIFDKFEDNNEVTTVIVNKSAFELMVKFGKNDPQTKEFAEIAKNLYQLKIFTTENNDIAKEMGIQVKAYLKSSKLDELMSVKDKEANVKIYIKEGSDANHVSELLMFVDSAGIQSQAVIISLTGDIDINKMSDLFKELNMEGAEHFKK